MVSTTGHNRGRLAPVSGCAALALLLGLASAARAEAPCGSTGPQLRVVVEGLKSARGYVSVEVYPDRPNLFFRPKRQVAIVREKLSQDAATVCVSLPKAGYYALAVYHDENGDNKLNVGPLGIPTEGFGLSNNPKIAFGLPSFNKVRFRAFEGETTVPVSMRYLGAPTLPQGGDVGLHDLTASLELNNHR